MAANTPNALQRGDEVARLEKMIDGNKGTVSETQRREYIDTWVALAKREGLKPNVIEILFNGFPIAEAEPLYRYVLETNDRDAYNKLFISSQAREDNVLAMKIALNLLAYELILPTYDDSVDLVARRLSGVILTKNGKPQSALKSNVGTLLVRPLSKASISEFAHIESPRATSLANYLRPGLNAVVSRRGAKPGDVRAANDLMDWLGKQKVVYVNEEPTTPNPDITESKAVVRDLPKHNVPNTLTDKPDHEFTSPGLTSSEAAIGGKQPAGTASGNSKPVKSNKPIKSGDSAKPVKESGKKSVKVKDESKNGDLDMATVIAFLSKFQKDYDGLKTQLESIRSEKLEMSGRVVDLEQELRASQHVIRDLKDYQATLSANYSVLQKQCEALRTENHSLRNEIDAANEVIAMMDEGSTHEAEAALGSLGRELSYDYRKYLAAADQTMTEELGRIVLGQLRTVFEILKSHGIDLQ